MAKYVHFNFVVYIVVFILSITGEFAPFSYRCFHGFPLTLLYCDFYGVSDVTLDAWAKTTHINVYKNRTIRTFHWRHNGCDGVLIHQRPDCLFNRLFRRRSKKIPKPRVTSLCADYSPVTGEYPHKGPVTRKMFPFDDVFLKVCVYYRVLLHETDNKLWSVFLVDLHCDGADWWENYIESYLIIILL